MHGSSPSRILSSSQENNTDTQPARQPLGVFASPFVLAVGPVYVRYTIHTEYINILAATSDICGPTHGEFTYGRFYGVMGTTALLSFHSFSRACCFGGSPNDVDH
jgi:hypothetical protein